MNTLNEVRDSLINLGHLQGFDLTDPKVSVGIDYETGNPRWLKDYTHTGDWDKELKEELKQFIDNINIYQISINDENLKIADYALYMAQVYAHNLHLYFDCIKDDIDTLINAKYKTNNFTWVSENKNSNEHY